MTTTLNTGEMRLEMLHIPVTDVDRARDFYVQQCGWTLITDHVQMDDMRIVQIVPAGSQKGIHLVVPDVAAARQQLAGNGVDMGGIQDLGGVLYSRFEDPDGNM